MANLVNWKEVVKKLHARLEPGLRDQTSFDEYLEGGMYAKRFTNDIRRACVRAKVENNPEGEEGFAIFKDLWHRRLAARTKPNPGEGE